MYTWDCENRLTAVAKPSPGAGDKKVVFGYDYQGRRVRRQVFAWNTGSSSWETTPESDQRFVYDGWNVVLVLNGLNSNSIQTKYTWGLDLAGQSGNAGAAGIHGAGGIGGLLAAVETQGTYQGTYWYLYDGNGNVGQVLSASSYDVVAHYEYDPYGNAIVATGAYAAANPIRFSTKHWDTVVGLGYWGERYYSPTTGRWLSRDPLEEEGGLNLYAYVHGSVFAFVDPTGAQAQPIVAPSTAEVIADTIKPIWPAIRPIIGEIIGGAIATAEVIGGAVIGGAEAIGGAIGGGAAIGAAGAVIGGGAVVCTATGCTIGIVGRPHNGEITLCSQSAARAVKLAEELARVTPIPIVRPFPTSPPGDCTQERWEQLQGDVAKHCHGVLRRCTWDQDCDTLRLNLGLRLACAAAREAINTECFRGGNPIHIDELKAERRGIAQCERIIAAKKCK